MPTTVAEPGPLFVDTNVLIYANVAEAPFHDQALVALDRAAQTGRELWISRQVLREFAVVRSRSQAFAESASAAIVVERLRYFEAHFRVADDTKIVTDYLLRLMAELQVGGKQIHDANIVATMLAWGIPELLTNNAKDFQRFSELIRISEIT